MAQLSDFRMPFGQESVHVCRLLSLCIRPDYDNPERHTLCSV